LSQAPARVAVDGATGYLGNHVVAQLRAQGFDVLCLVHSGAREKDIAFLKSLGAETVVVSLEKENDELVTSLKQCAYAIHLIGSIAPKKGETLAGLHGSQAATLVAAAKKAGIRKLIQVTALGSSANAASEYHRTKWEAEEFFRNSGIPHIIYQPSLIIGKACGNRNSKLVSRYMDLIDSRPRVPVIGGGANKVQPIFVVDLAQAIVAGLLDDRYNNRAYELGGPEVLSMRQFVEKLIKFKDSDKSIAAIPIFAVSIAASVLEKIQSVPIVSRDQVTLSQTDNVCKSNALDTIFGIRPTSVDEALNSYRERNATEMAASGK
jgi:uncharacterized protein YbjT (DUF2867 family)